MKNIAVLALAGMLATAVSGSAADAKTIWEKDCAKCHGADGKGQTTMGKKLKVKDYTDAAEQAKFKDEEAVKAIKEGKKDGDKVRMKAFAETYGDDEIKALVQLLRTFKK